MTDTVFNLRSQPEVSASVVGSGSGTSSDPFKPYHGSQLFYADADNILLEYLENGGSRDQAVNGSVTPVTFSTPTVASGKILVLKRIMFFMESPGAMSSELFGSLAELTTGWQLATKGVAIATIKSNRSLATPMFDAQGVKFLGKEDKTMLGRLSFDKFTPDGLILEAGEVFSTIVNDDLSTLTYLEVVAEGYYKDA